jgi:hypothetical protein
MKPQAGQFQVIQLFGSMDRIENLDATLRQILPDAAAPPGLKQFLEASIGKRLNHGRAPTLRCISAHPFRPISAPDICKEMLSMRQVTLYD